MNPPTLELLAPARDADIGIEAIRHGADAVYIGGPAFGARHGAGNAIADIERLARFAHRFHARVFVTLNTIFTDAELEPAAQLAHDVYAAGADALIVQDMGLLECDLPPIELHASTQCDIRTPAKACFQNGSASACSPTSSYAVASSAEASADMPASSAACVRSAACCGPSFRRACIAAK